MNTNKSFNSVSLALGAGAFRGLAHIGVIKTLQANNLSINAISGSSIGSLIAAYFALHQEVDSLQTKILSEKNRKFKISDFSLRGGLVSSKKFQDFIGYLLGDLKFSDTKMPLRIVATDMYSGLPYIFEKGSLALAVCASASVPLIFEPSIDKKRQFLDGALSNPVPVQPLKDLGYKKIVAVNLYHRHELKDRKTSFSNIAVRSMRTMLSNLASHDVKNASICLSPDVSQITKKVSNFKLRTYLSPQIANKIINIGSQETENKLEDIFKILSK